MGVNRPRGPQGKGADSGLIGFNEQYSLEKDAIVASVGAFVARLRAEADYVRAAWEKLFDQISLVSYHRAAATSWLMGLSVDFDMVLERNPELDKYYYRILDEVKEPKEQFDYLMELAKLIESLFISIAGDLDNDSKVLTADLIKKNPELEGKEQEVKKVVDDSVKEYLPEPTEKILTPDEVKTARKQKVPETEAEFVADFDAKIQSSLRREISIERADPFVYEVAIVESLLLNLNKFWDQYAQSQLVLSKMHVLAGALSIPQVVVNSYGFEVERSGMMVNPFNLNNTPNPYS